jgi:hypothetical protein
MGGRPLGKVAGIRVQLLPIVHQSNRLHRDDVPYLYSTFPTFTPDYTLNKALSIWSLRQLKLLFRILNLVLVAAGFPSVPK